MSANLDHVDRQILHALGINGRATFRQLAGVFGVSEYTVGRRYRRLVKENMVRVVAVRTPDEQDLGELLRLQVVPGSSVRLTEALVKRDDVSWLRTAGSGAEIVCGVRSPSPHQRDQLILDQLPKTRRITKVTAHHVLHHFRIPGHADWEGFPDQLTEEQRASLRVEPSVRAQQSSVSRSDMKLIDALALDARQSAAQIAVAIGEPEPSVRRRLDQLLSAGSIQLDRDLDPTRLGYAVGANVYIDVEPRHLHDAGATLAEHEPTTFVAAVSGPTNLFASVASPSIRDFYDYVSSTLTEVQGITHIETSLTGPYLKHTRTAWR